LLPERVSKTTQQRDAIAGSHRTLTLPAERGTAESP